MQITLKYLQENKVQRMKQIPNQNDDRLSLSDKLPCLPCFVPQQKPFRSFQLFQKIYFAKILLEKFRVHTIPTYCLINGCFWLKGGR